MNEYEIQEAPDGRESIAHATQTRPTRHSMLNRHFISSFIDIWFMLWSFIQRSEYALVWIIQPQLQPPNLELYVNTKRKTSIKG